MLRSVVNSDKVMVASQALRRGIVPKIFLTQTAMKKGTTTLQLVVNNVDDVKVIHIELDKSQTLGYNERIP